jgi:odorant receptor
MKNRVKFENFIRQMDAAYNEISMLKDDVIKADVSFYTTRAVILTIFNQVLGIVISIFFVVYPLFAGRNLPYALWIPGVDIYKSPIYEIVYIVEV